MSDIKLFRTEGPSVTQLEGKSVALEKSLQTLIEAHLDVFLGIRFLETEYSTGKTHAGRIDTLGIDENGCPCIIEYKRSANENVINQGLFYLDWLLDHKAEFELMVLRKYGATETELIEWSTPRLLCIAGDFTKYDQHAVQQINRNIELIRYQRFGEEFLLLELVNAVQAREPIEHKIETLPVEAEKPKQTYKTITEQLADASPELTDLYEQIRETCLSYGDDVQMTTLKFYIAFKRLKNFCSVEVRPRVATILVWVKINPESIDLEEGFTRDVRKIGHFGTGDLEITIRNQNDLTRALPLIQGSYEAS